jgi:exoribonuclease R
MVMAGRVAGFIGKNYSIPLPYRYHLPQTQEGCKTDSIEQRLRFLDSLRPAAIDSRPQYHWAMGLFGYVKATSPLRRYLDLLTHQQLKTVVLHGKQAPYSEEELRKMLPRMYSNELYIKRLQHASIKYWLLTHLQTMLQRTGPIECDAVYTKEDNYFLDMYNTVFYIRTVTEQEDYTRVRLRLQSADPIRMYIDAQVLK